MDEVLSLDEICEHFLTAAQNKEGTAKDLSSIMVSTLENWIEEKYEPRK